METIVEAKRETPVAMEVDVVVAGGGPAGFTAAVAAAIPRAVDEIMAIMERWGRQGSRRSIVL